MRYVQRTRYVHVGGYVSGFIDGRQRYAVRTKRADDGAIGRADLDKVKRASIRAARKLGMTGELVASPVYNSVTVGSWTVRGADIVTVQVIARDI